MLRVDQTHVIVDLQLDFTTLAPGDVAPLAFLYFSRLNYLVLLPSIDVNRAEITVLNTIHVLVRLVSFLLAKL